MARREDKKRRGQNVFKQILHQISSSAQPRLIATNPGLAPGGLPAMSHAAPGNPDSHEARAESTLSLPQSHAVRACVGQKLIA